jgi:hypothetical protein
MKKTRQRVLTACLGAFLSVLAAFSGGGLTVWAFLVHSSGMATPEFGWIGIFILNGFFALILVAPAFLTILACGVVWRTPAGKHALFSTVVPLFLGGIAIALLWLNEPKNDAALPGVFTVVGAVCLAITVVVEVLMKNRLQSQEQQEPEVYGQKPVGGLAVENW